MKSITTIKDHVQNNQSAMWLHCSIKHVDTCLHYKLLHTSKLQNEFLRTVVRKTASTSEFSMCILGCFSANNSCKEWLELPKTFWNNNVHVIMNQSIAIGYSSLSLINKLLLLITGYLFVYSIVVFFPLLNIKYMQPLAKIMESPVRQCLPSFFTL